MAQVAVRYELLLGLVAVAALVAVSDVGHQVSTLSLKKRHVDCGDFPWFARRAPLFTGWCRHVVNISWSLPLTSHRVSRPVTMTLTNYADVETGAITLSIAGESANSFGNY